MKRFIALLLTLTMALCLCACGGSTSSGSADTVDESLLTVEITIPADFYEKATAEQVVKNAKAEGLHCTLNSDGSITYKLTEEQQQALLDDFNDSIDEAISKLLDGPDAVESFTLITAKNDRTAFDVYVDPALYSSEDVFYAFTFHLYGAYYQILAGGDPNTVNVVVSFINKDTNEVLDQSTLR